jgi:hypothetical protein
VVKSIILEKIINDMIYVIILSKSNFLICPHIESCKDRIDDVIKRRRVKDRDETDDVVGRQQQC